MIKRICNTHISRATAIALAVLILISAVMAATGIADGIRASASSGTSQISRLRNEKADYERQKKEINERIETLEFERMTELDKKALLDERMILTGMEISNLNEIINHYNLLISEKEYEVIIARNREEEQLNKYKSRVRYLEENYVYSYLAIIFDSASILDFIASVDFVNGIINADKDTYLSLQQARELTTAAMDGLEEIKAELDIEYAKLDSLKKELDEQLEESHALILKMESDIDMENRLYEKVSEEEDRVQKEIYQYESQLRRQREAERQKQAQQQAAQSSQTGTGTSSSSSNTTGAVTGTGELMWPVQGQIISSFGMRSGRMHQGLDIGAAHGTVVVAADGGTVITSSYGSGYGNYVVISHGNGMTTLYSHLSSRSVKAGDTVSKGQQVGLVGSTGNASCPHLHFEVSVDGVRVNPVTKL